MTDSRDSATSSCRYVAVGAGRMGRGIAIAFALAGYRIALLDLRQRTAAAWQVLSDSVTDEVASTLQSLVELGLLTAQQVQPVTARIELAPVGRVPEVLAAAEVVFECVPETMDAKRDAYRVLNQYSGEETIVTSTTSSILVTDLVALVERPQRFFNMHWLNPAYLIPVVEISSHAQTDPAAIATVKAAVEAIGKVPVVCGPAPGYIVPRLQALIMNEAARIVEEGIATPEEVDKATRFGLGLRFSSIGVLEFIDYGGCEILQRASHQMSKTIDPHRYQAPAVIESMIQENRLGLRTGSGFFDYDPAQEQAYRKDVLSRTVEAIAAADLLHETSSDTKG